MSVTPQVTVHIRLVTNLSIQSSLSEEVTDRLLEAAGDNSADGDSGGTERNEGGEHFSVGDMDWMVDKPRHFWRT